MTEAEEDLRMPDDSLCHQPSDTPRSFHYYSSHDGTIHVHREMVDAAWIPGRAMGLAAGMVGDFEARIKFAARGELRSGADGEELVAPVRRDPHVWEIRWKVGRQGEYRLYHAEPTANPQLVALRFHEKDTSSGDADTIDALQEVEMDEAARRYKEGVNRKWGHRKSCADCIAA
jgi:hypothetical protein